MMMFRLNHSRSRHDCGGFTLLEVLIALSIFAICASTLLQQSGRSVRQASYLETRAQASWIAENELARLRLSEQFAPVGKQEKEITFANRQWFVSQDITNTNNKDLRKAVIEVRDSDSELATRFQLIGFLGRY
ncbi:type II secretion system minor pseudopilin GspI [Pseudomaricurvus albidus]|uniref:type II secretion system minor pseudopilin GspI n=1 Tax=Pseudomaricurvus albidus TaxID=2842452 RepID=UPI001F3D2B41|nr:type II secretion system minor pseudopilin GspI [Aestuariicella albida]